MDGTTMIETALTIAALHAVTYIALVAVSASVAPIRRWFASIGELVMRPFWLTSARTDATARRKQIDAEIDRELGQADPWGRQARADVLHAAVSSQRIRLLDDKFRTAVRT